MSAPPQTPGVTRDELMALNRDLLAAGPMPRHLGVLIPDPPPADPWAAKGIAWVTFKSPNREPLARASAVPTASGIARAPTRQEVADLVALCEVTPGWTMRPRHKARAVIHLRVAQGSGTEGRFSRSLSCWSAEGSTAICTTTLESPEPEDLKAWLERGAPEVWLDV